MVVSRNSPAGAGRRKANGLGGEDIPLWRGEQQKTSETALSSGNGGSSFPGDKQDRRYAGGCLEKAGESPSGFSKDQDGSLSPPCPLERALGAMASSCGTSLLGLASLCHMDVPEPKKPPLFPWSRQLGLMRFSVSWAQKLNPRPPNSSHLHSLPLPGTCLPVSVPSGDGDDDDNVTVILCRTWPVESSQEYYY